MPNDSIYDGQRLAQPDEVWNFGRGDGMEKALTLANYLFNIKKQEDISLFVDKDKVILQAAGTNYNFVSAKNLVKQMDLCTQLVL